MDRITEMLLDSTRTMRATSLSTMSPFIKSSSSPTVSIQPSGGGGGGNPLTTSGGTPEKIFQGDFSCVFFSPLSDYWPFFRVQESRKQGLFQVKIKSNWSERWIVLYYNSLISYKPNKSQAPKPDTKPEDIILLKSFNDFISPEEKANTFTVLLKDKTIVYQAMEEESVKEWIEEINSHRAEVIKLCEFDKKINSWRIFHTNEIRFALSASVNHSQIKIKRGDSEEWLPILEAYFAPMDPSALSYRESIALAHKDVIQLDDQLFSSQMMLEDRLKRISEPDEWFELFLSLKRLMFNSELFGLGLLVMKLERPFDMLVKEPSFEDRCNPYHKIEELLQELDQWLQSKLYKDKPEVTELIKKIKEFYSRWLRSSKMNPDLTRKHRLMIGHGFGCRVLPRILVDKILGERENDYGLHAVTSYGGIHFKRNPESPGYEFAVHCLNKLVTGQGSSPAELIKIHNVLIQASLTVDGVNIKSLLLKNQCLLDYVNPLNYSSLFLSGLLTDLQDGKPDNFLVRIHTDLNSLEIVGIDNDVAFANPIVKQDGKHFINVRNIVYLLKQADDPIHSLARKSLLQMSPEAVLFEWLRFLYKKNQEYEKMHIAEKIFSAEELTKMAIPIKLCKGTVIRLYKKIIHLKKILLETPNCTHNQLFQKLQPVVYYYYRKISSEEPTILDRFERIFSGPFLEDILPEMMDEMVSEKYTFRQYMTHHAVNSARDFRTQRVQTIPEAMQEFLFLVNFSEISEDVERDILAVVCNSGIPFRKFFLRGSGCFNDRNLQFLLDTSVGYLEELELINCSRVTDQGLKLVAYMPKKPHVILQECPLITLDCAKTLRTDHGVNITILYDLDLSEGEPTKAPTSKSLPSNPPSTTKNQILLPKRITRSTRKAFLTLDLPTEDPPEFLPFNENSGISIYEPPKSPIQSPKSRPKSPVPPMRTLGSQRSPQTLQPSKLQSRTKPPTSPKSSGIVRPSRANSSPAPNATVKRAKRLTRKKKKDEKILDKANLSGSQKMEWTTTSLVNAKITKLSLQLNVVCLQCQQEMKLLVDANQPLQCSCSSCNIPIGVCCMWTPELQPTVLLEGSREARQPTLIKAALCPERGTVIKQSKTTEDLYKSERKKDFRRSKSFQGLQAPKDSKVVWLEGGKNN